MFSDNCASWRNPRILTVLLLIFLSGGVVGAVAMRAGLQQMMSKSGPYWKEGGKEFSLQKFKRELELSPEQAQQMEIVLDDFVMYYHTLQAQMDEVRAAGKDKILRILNEGQKRKFQQMMNEVQAKQLR
jgi:hypothetical protein